jgi:hypothetical protein
MSANSSGSTTHCPVPSPSAYGSDSFAVRPPNEPSVYVFTAPVRTIPLPWFVVSPSSTSASRWSAQ